MAIPEAVLDEQALVKRLSVDKELLMQLLLQKDTSLVLQQAGFHLGDESLMRVLASLKKIRAYATDQLHVLAHKFSANPSMTESGNGPGW